MQVAETSGPSPSGRKKRRRLWQAAIGLAIVIVALGVFAWQQGDDEGGGGPLNAIAKAAEKTQAQPGGRAVMHSSVEVAGGPAITMTGRFVYNAEEHTRGVITAPNTPNGPIKLEMVTDGTTMYMHSSQFGDLPDGRGWMGLDLALGDELDTSIPENVDAKGELALLGSVGDDVRKLGKKDVRGVPTTHYGGSISVSDQVDRLREEGGDAAATLIEKDGSPLHVEAWIDADGLIRRMRVVHVQPAEEGKGAETMDMRVDFFDFGFEPEIDVPDSSEVFDATGMTRREVGISDDE